MVFYSFQWTSYRESYCIIFIQVTKQLTICKLRCLEKMNDLLKVTLALPRIDWSLSSVNFCAPPPPQQSAMSAHF